MSGKGRRISRAACLSAFLAPVLCFAGSALAQGADKTGAAPVPVQRVPAIQMEQYGKDNPRCAEWYDGCRVCLRDRNNKISCSTPGIACVRKPVLCRSMLWNPPETKKKTPGAKAPDAGKKVE